MGDSLTEYHYVLLRIKLKETGMDGPIIVVGKKERIFVVVVNLNSS